MSAAAIVIAVILAQQACSFGLKPGAAAPFAR
jgi:hypothetical protein